jgi:hypothetical protein
LLLPRLEENGQKLVAAYKELAESIRAEHVISTAAEWLVDNFHMNLKAGSGLGFAILYQWQGWSASKANRTLNQEVFSVCKHPHTSAEVYSFK